MSWKNFVFANAEGGDKGNEKKTESQESFKSKFPTSTPVEAKNESATVATAITPDNPQCAPHLDKIMDLYEKGFEGLNMDGYDFFEFYKAVVAAGVNNANAYTMAFNMAKAMDGGVTKESLASQAQYYLDEISKVHTHYNSNGENKRKEAQANKVNEEATLENELTEINNEIARLNALKAQKQGELARIDSKYTPEITDIECKLMANDMARDAIVGSIQAVVDGINKNV